MFKRGIFVIILFMVLGINFSFPKNSLASFGDYTGVSFDTASSGNGNPGHMTVYNDFFWVTDVFDLEVYKYNTDGTYTGTSFDTGGSGNDSLYGITNLGGFFWITDPVDDKVYKYNSDGTYTGTSFDTAGIGNNLPRGITAYDGYLWVADSEDNKVYKYETDGTYTGVFLDTSVADVTNAIYFYDNIFWVGGGGTNAVRKYETDGTYTGVYFSPLHHGGGIGDIAVYDGYFWIREGSVFYQYELTDTTNPTISTFTYPDHGASDIMINTEFSLSFNEKITYGTGFITIKNAENNSIVEEIDIQGAQVSGDRSTTLSFDLTLNLEEDTSYYVQIDPTAVSDLVGNFFTGINDSITWEFRTGLDYYDSSFNIDSGFDPLGIDFNDFFWILTNDSIESTYQVEKYNTNGTDAGFSFDVNGSSFEPTDVLVDGNFFFVLGYDGNEGVYLVQKYDSSGVYVEDFFELESGFEGNGFDIYQNIFYIMGWDDNQGIYSVQKYDSSGVYLGDFLELDTTLYGYDINYYEDYFYLSIDGDELSVSVIKKYTLEGEFVSNFVGLTNYTSNQESNCEFCKPTFTIYDGYVWAIDDGNVEIDKYIFPVEETPTRSSSGSIRTVVQSQPILIIASFTPNLVSECLPEHKFSNITGLSCNTNSNTNTTTPSSTTSNEFKFLTNLGSGTIHSDVKELQKYLNTHNFPVALSGPGSLGFETNKFGALTRASLIKFQLANNITPPVGFFGPITRGVINQ